MELIIILVAMIAIIIIQTIMKINVNELEKIALNSELNEITKKCADDMNICRTILNKLGNKTTQIEIDKNSEATLYIAIQDKISIGNTHESFTRIQTISHECLHSIQDRKMLIFNFIYSNIYLIYFGLICILTIINKLPNEMLFSNVLLILSFIYYSTRVFLENDAMIKAEYVAKEYLEEEKILSSEEIKKVFKGFKQLNDKCIKGTNCSLFIKIMIKVVIFNVLALIF